MRSNIKVGTIVNIIRVYNDYARKIAQDERELDRCRVQGDKNGILFAEIELNKDKAKMAEFLDYYV